MTKAKPKELHKKPGPKGPFLWTEDEAMQLGNALLDWHEASEANVYWEEFIYLVAKNIKPEWHRINPETISYLTSRHSEFNLLIKRAKKLQELRLVKKEGKGEIKSMFVLKNHHGYADKQEVKQDSTVHTTFNDVTRLKELGGDELKDQLRWLTETAKKG